MTDKEGTHAMNPQPTAAPAAPITPEEIAALRDALSKATPGEWTVEFESSDQTMCGKDMATVYSGRSDRFHGLNLLGRLFDLGPQGERDLSAAVAAYNLAPKLLARVDAAEAEVARLSSENETFKKFERDQWESAKKAFGSGVVKHVTHVAELEQIRAKRDEQVKYLREQAVAAEAKAVEFAWDVLAFAGTQIAADEFDDRGVTRAKDAAEYLAKRKLLKRTGERAWQRVEGGK